MCYTSKQIATCVFANLCVRTLWMAPFHFVRAFARKKALCIMLEYVNTLRKYQGVLEQPVSL